MNRTAILIAVLLLFSLASLSPPRSYADEVPPNGKLSTVSNVQPTVAKGMKAMTADEVIKYLEYLNSYVARTHDLELNGEIQRLNKSLGRRNLSVRGRKILEDKLKLATESKRTPPVQQSEQQGGTVICTELARQGYVSSEILSADGEFAREIVPPASIALYQYWAKPVVRLMRKSSLVTAIVRPFGVAWAQHMAFAMGVASSDSWLGFQITRIFVPIHNAVSKHSFPELGHVSAKRKIETLERPSLPEALLLLGFILAAVPFGITICSSLIVRACAGQKVLSSHESFLA